MDNEIGFFHFREVDSLRYKLYQLNDGTVFYLYDNKKYKLTVPNKFKNKNLHVVVSKCSNYDNYQDEIIDELNIYKKYPIGCYINNEYIATNIEFPNEYIFDILKN